MKINTSNPVEILKNAQGSLAFPAFGRSKSEILIDKKPENLMKNAGNLAFKLNSLEEQLNKRLEDVRFKMKDDVFLETKEEKILEIPKEFMNIQIEFSLLASWMKSVLLNFHFRKSLDLNILNFGDFSQEIKGKIKDLSVSIRKTRISRRNSIKTLEKMEKEAEFNDVFSGFFDEIEEKIEDCNKNLDILQRIAEKFEGMKKFSPNYQPRKLK